jgi:ABC-2 type transport system permease protein
MGLLFLASVYVNIGIFASWIIDNRIVAFITAVTLSFLCYFGFDLIVSLTLSGTSQTFVAAFGINSHYQSMSCSVIDSRDAVYFLSVMALLPFATRWVISEN